MVYAPWNVQQCMGRIQQNAYVPLTAICHATASYVASSLLLGYLATGLPFSRSWVCYAVTIPHLLHTVGFLVAYAFWHTGPDFACHRFYPAVQSFLFNHLIPTCVRWLSRASTGRAMGKQAAVRVRFCVLTILFYPVYFGWNG